jgi:hypothetical protein
MIGSSLQDFPRLTGRAAWSVLVARSALSCPLIIFSLLSGTMKFLSDTGGADFFDT